MTTSTASSVTFQEVEICLKKALDDFRMQDLQLLELSADERAATHRIACYLQKYFPDWHVDCEYNRRGREQKKIDAVLVRPDIIIHRRNTNQNLLCIEAKKAGKLASDIDEDRKKLCEFTTQKREFRYHFGLLMHISLKVPYKIDFEWFHNGEEKSEEQLHRL